MARIPIALQLYSVRNDCAQDLLGTIRKVAKMGYDGVEFAGYHGHTPEAIKAVLDEVGLKCAGTHTPIHALDEENFAETVRLHKVLDTKFVIIPWIPEEMRNTEASTKETCKRLTELTQKLSAEGLCLGFHAHAGDMKPLDGGKSAWQLIAENTPAEFVMQYDTANGVDGGADAVQPILDVPGRAKSVHLKEYKGGHGKAVVGEGDIPWEKVFEAAEKVGGVEWYVVEHESEEQGPPIEAVERCLQNLRKMGK
ncbi:MAG: sugar phosphate isomerase/epimerase family protein [Fimbriimonadaceae bacterium]